MEHKLQKVWDNVGNKISQIVNEKADELNKLGIKPITQPAICAEGGFMIGYYPERGFDIRAYGWTPSSVMNNKLWYKQIHWGTAMGSCTMEVYKFAQNLVEEAQIVWDEDIKSL